MRTVLMCGYEQASRAPSSATFNIPALMWITGLGRCAELHRRAAKVREGPTLARHVARMSRRVPNLCTDAICTCRESWIGVCAESLDDESLALRQCSRAAGARV